MKQPAHALALAVLAAGVGVLAILCCQALVYRVEYVELWVLIAAVFIAVAASLLPSLLSFYSSRFGRPG
jgi:hypothetical protein